MSIQNSGLVRIIVLFDTVHRGNPHHCFPLIKGSSYTLFHRQDLSNITFNTHFKALIKMGTLQWLNIVVQASQRTAVVSRQLFGCCRLCVCVCVCVCVLVCVCVCSFCVCLVGMLLFKLTPVLP